MCEVQHAWWTVVAITSQTKGRVLGDLSLEVSAEKTLKQGKVYYIIDTYQYRHSRLNLQGSAQ